MYDGVAATNATRTQSASASSAHTARRVAGDRPCIDEGYLCGTRAVSRLTAVRSSGCAFSRRWVVAILVVGATVFALVSIHALWANRQFLNTDNWTKTSSELLQREAVRTQVADFLVDQLSPHVNVRGELESALPPQAKALAGPVAGGLRNVADQGINKLLQRPRVQQLWENANRAAHTAFLKTIEGGGPNVSTTGGNVTLNLGQIAASVATSLGLGNVASKIPPDAAQITVLKSNQLEAVQNGFKALRGITLVVVLLTLLLYVIAVVVAQDRRRQALRMVGWSLIVAGVLSLLVRTFVGQQVVDSLSTTASVRAAVSDTWDVASSLLVQAAQSTIAYGVVVVLGAWLAGPTRPAVAAATSWRRSCIPRAGPSAAWPWSCCSSWSGARRRPRASRWGC